MHEWDLDLGPRGLRLRVCEWGSGGGVPVVVLHGFLEQGAAWDAVAKQLPGRILAPDQRGHGRSEHVGRGGYYHFWDYVGDLDALVRSLGGVVDLVGHSMGGTIGSLFAGCRPEAVRRLVLVEGLGPPDSTGQAVRRARQYLDGLRDGLRHGPIAGIEDAAARLRRYNASLDEPTSVMLAERLVDDGGWRWDPLHRGRTPAPFDAARFCEFLREITAPVLLVDGGASSFVVPDLAERAACLRDARRVVIEGAGHLVHHDRPGELARVIAEHLTR